MYYSSWKTREKYVTMWINALFIVLLIIGSRSKLTRINSKPRSIVFKYREGVTGEKSLPQCQPNEACNIVHRRFWLANLVERLCRCSDGDECPWTIKFDNYTMSINNRSVIKFCEPVNGRRICKPRKISAVINGEINKNFTSMTVHNVMVNCICPKTHYWQLKKYDYADNELHQNFRCSKQTICGSFQFCGFVRPDFYSVYYRCSCPPGNLCITRDDKIENVQEFAYSGPALRAYCDPWNISSRYY